MRSLRHEIISAATVLSLPLAIALVFPFESIGFSARKVKPEVTASAAFVTLGDDIYDLALKTARVSWNGHSGGNGSGGYLSLGELPASDERAVLGGFGSPMGAVELAPVVSTPVPWLPSAAADAPVQIPNDPASAVKPAFSREEMLRNVNL